MGQAKRRKQFLGDQYGKYFYNAVAAQVEDPISALQALITMEEKLMTTDAPRNRKEFLNMIYEQQYSLEHITDNQEYFEAAIRFVPTMGAYTPVFKTERDFAGIREKAKADVKNRSYSLPYPNNM